MHDLPLFQLDLLVVEVAKLPWRTGSLARSTTSYLKNQDALTARDACRIASLFYYLAGRQHIVRVAKNETESTKAYMKRFYATRRRVEFCDTDMAGISHFTNFFKYMEQAEHEFLRHVGKNVVLYDERGTMGFPKLEAHCRYRHPAVHGAELVIELTIICDDGKTIQYDCSIFDSEQSNANRILLAEGFLRVACCRFPPDGLPFPIPIPDHVLAAIEAVTTAA